MLNSNRHLDDLDSKIDFESRPLPLMFKSNSFVHLRDKEFYDMVLDEEEATNVEQNMFEALQLKMLS